MPNLKLNAIFHFASAHFLTKYKGNCENLHGHNYKLLVTIKGPIKDDGMLMDFKKIKAIVKENIINKLDHKLLNDILDNPTAEHIAIWIWNELKEKLPLSKITIYETDNYYAEYEG